MPRKMQLFHQLDEKIAKTFLADFICEVLYIWFAQLRQPEQVCGTRKNGASRLLNCTYILHTKLEKP